VTDPRSGIPAWPRAVTIREAGALGRQAILTAGLGDPGLESALLLGHVLHLNRAGLLIYGADILSAREATEFRALMARRIRREPTAYLTGVKQWLDVAVTVNRNVLIPRPETEILARMAIKECAEQADRLDGAPLVVDVGTGSGALACAVARSCPWACVTATDLAPGALRTARRNVERLAGGRVELLCCDLLPHAARFDLVVANLPYIPNDELGRLQPELAYEPREALAGGADGLAVIEALLHRLDGGLAPRGTALLECHHDQAARLAARASSLLPGCRTAIERDLAGVERFVRVELR
jgi:release factor glutamine methyltransferase